MSAESNETAQPNSRSSSGRPADVLKIRILSIALATVLVAFSFYVLVSEGAFDSPYPSQNTPLTLQPWGVTWSRSHNETLNGEIPIWAYTNITVALTEYREDSISGCSGPFDIGESIDVSDFVPPTAVEGAEEMSWLGHLIYYEDDVEVHLFTTYFVSDRTDRDVFNGGDTVSFVHLVYKDGSLSSVGFEEDIVYEIELTCAVSGLTTQEAYGLAVHDGVLYSWIDRGPIDDPLT